MIRSVVCGAFALLAGSALAIAAPKDDVSAAAKKLASADNYSWKQTSENAGGQGGGGGGGRRGPEVTCAKGHAKFWVKDGMLNKYEYTVSGSVNFNGNDQEINRTTKVEISDVGSTKVNIPEEAKKKLES